MANVIRLLISLCLLVTAPLASDRASAQAISNILIPPQTILGNMQGSASGASALRFCDFAVTLSQRDI